MNEANQILCKHLLGLVWMKNNAAVFHCRNSVLELFFLILFYLKNSCVIVIFDQAGNLVLGLHTMQYMD